MTQKAGDEKDSIGVIDGGLEARSVEVAEESYFLLVFFSTEMSTPWLH